MRGRAHTMFTDLQSRLSGQPFRLATAILQEHITPRRITPWLDDPEIERRLARALESTDAAPA
jgi:hypothetical protein